MNIEGAIACLKANGYRVSKPCASRQLKSKPQPTFVAKFADGQVTRMTTYTTTDKLDGLPDHASYDRGIRHSIAAYQDRNANWFALLGLDVVSDIPAIVAARFERDGVTIFAWDGLNASLKPKEKDQP